ncbi:MAG: YbaK/EbsC family protein [Hyphomicrobiales bacterium]|nr:YbaK/EbsC family protein [Hyphomicrobiales bacterium]MCP4997993.1 YbaK/EbsC family protein [Hyphomicrobiales bacterium]
MSAPTDQSPKRSSMDRVRDAAGELGHDIEIVKMDQSTRTAQEAADACECVVGQIIKSLVFEDAADQSLVLILVSGSNNADLQLFQQAHGLTLQRCDTRKVRNVTGFAIGGVAPIGHLNPIRTFMDEDLLAYDVVWAAAGRPDSVFSVDPVALAKATGAHTARVSNQR